MLTERIETLLVGNATGLVNTFREGGAASDAFAGKATSTGRLLDKLGLQGQLTGAQIGGGIAVGAGLAGIALAKFAFDGVENFSNLTGEVRTLRAQMGGTAEDASRVAGVARQLGIDTDTVAKGFFQLTKRIGESKDTLAQYGVEVVRNDNGSVNSAKTLLNISDVFKAMQDPAERNAFLMQNFGRAGAQLIPVLTQGRAQLEQFYAMTDRHHEIFSEEDLQKGREYKLAMRELDDAWTGLSTELGRELVPAITQFARGLEEVVSWIPAFVGFLDRIDDFVGFSNLVNGTRAFFASWGIGSEEAKRHVGYLIDGVQEMFQGLDASAAAHQFETMNAAADKSKDSVGHANNALRNFVQIAMEDVVFGQQVIDGLKARGVNTDLYERALKHIAATKLEDIANTQKQKDMEVLLTGTYDQQIKKLDELQNAELAKFNNDIAAQQAIIRATEAQDAYNQSLTDGTSSAQDQQKALLDAESAALSAAAAAGKKAEADHEGEGAAASHAAGTYAQIAALQQLRSTTQDGSPLALALDGYIARLADPNVNGVHTAGVQLDPSFWDSLNALQRFHDLLELITGQPWQAVVQVTNQFDNMAGMPGG